MRVLTINELLQMTWKELPFARMRQSDDTVGRRVFC